MEKDGYCQNCPNPIECYQLGRCWPPVAKEKADDRLGATTLFGMPDDFEARMMEMDIHELRSRIVTQRDYLRKFHACLDGLAIPADCNSSFDGCRTHHDIRSIAEKLISRLPNVDVEASGPSPTSEANQPK